jgi:hypothetical protein
VAPVKFYFVNTNKNDLIFTGKDLSQRILSMTKEKKDTSEVKEFQAKEKF